MDPPYFIDGMGDDWGKDNLDTKAKKAGVIGGLPVGMKFDPQQGIRFQEVDLKSLPRSHPGSEARWVLCRVFAVWSTGSDRE